MNFKLIAVGTMGITMLAASIPAYAEGGAEAKEYQTTGDIKFKASSGTEKPLHPEKPDPSKPVEPKNPIDPDKPVRPGTEGPLSIDFVSDFQFGEQKISTKDETYLAFPQAYNGEQSDSANYVQVTDKRGTAAGWTLSVTQKDDFKSTVETTNNHLEGLELKLAANQGQVKSTSDSAKPIGKNVVLSGAGSHAEILTAEQLAGTGTWTSTIGNLVDNPVEEKLEEMPQLNEGVELFIPGEVQTDAVTYSTTLNWVLEQKP